MSNTPWKTGQSLPLWSVTLYQQRDDGSLVAMDLNGASSVDLYYQHRGTGLVTHGGPVTITNAGGGVVSYQFADEVTNPGPYRQEWKVTYSNGATKSDFKDWELVQSLS